MAEARVRFGEKEARPAALCDPLQPKLKKKNLNHYVKVINTTRTSSQLQHLDDRRCNSPGYQRDGHLPALFCFRELVMRSVMLWYVRMAEVVSSV